MNIPVKTWRFHGGVHPADGKALSNSVPAQRAPLLERYTVALQQNIGAPPKLVVAKGDVVNTSKGEAKVYDDGTESGNIDMYVNW